MDMTIRLEAQLPWHLTEGVVVKQTYWHCWLTMRCVEIRWSSENVTQDWSYILLCNGQDSSLVVINMVCKQT